MLTRPFSLIISLITAIGLFAADPMSTSYSYDDCQGSLTPYPEDVAIVVYPDSLKPIMINHVGRHGARYPASSANCQKLKKALMRADSAKTLTPIGKELAKINERVLYASNNRWGALDSLGEAEQRAIASRMYMAYPDVFEKANIKALSSYSPRAMMSMYAFTHQLDRLNNRMEFTTSSGRKNDWLLRPFDVDQEYIDFRKSKEADKVYNEYFESNCPVTAIERALGKDFPFKDEAEKRDLAITEYYVIAGLSAMSMPCDASKFFTIEEYNKLWSCFNLRQYLQRTATTLSAVPAEIAIKLLSDIITTTDAFIDGKSNNSVILRFGHAETLMPLLSLMRMPGCYYMTNYFDTVAQHWHDFYIVPMAANLQVIIFKSDKGRYYARFDLNETPVALIPNDDSIYIPWEKAKKYLNRWVEGVNLDL